MRPLMAPDRKYPRKSHSSIVVVLEIVEGNLQRHSMAFVDRKPSLSYTYTLLSLAGIPLGSALQSRKFPQVRSLDSGATGDIRVDRNEPECVFATAAPGLPPQPYIESVSREKMHGRRRHHLP
jgi:hypothetical protein